MRQVAASNVSLHPMPSTQATYVKLGKVLSETRVRRNFPAPISFLPTDSSL